MHGKSNNPLQQASSASIKHIRETLIQTVTFESCLHVAVESNEEMQPEARRQTGK
jgi:hypothetical protein